VAGGGGGGGGGGGQGDVGVRVGGADVWRRCAQLEKVAWLYLSGLAACKWPTPCVNKALSWVRVCCLQVQLLLGRLPSAPLIAAHGLQQYEPVIAALRHGNVKLFDDALAAQQLQFIQEVGICSLWLAECLQRG
jgi:hypothetical protein